MELNIGDVILAGSSGSLYSVSFKSSRLMSWTNDMLVDITFPILVLSSLLHELGVKSIEWSQDTC